jgi:hypothetical protein
MVGRLNDSAGQSPEIEEIRWACAISLGRMNAESALPSLRKSSGEGWVGGACFWAIEQITGEPAPQPRGQVQLIDGWFLAPIRDE